MALYDYTALDSGNTLKDGVLEEVDKAAVARRLLAKGLRPLEIRPHKDSRLPSFSFSFGELRRDKLTRVDIEFFTSQIGLLLNSGLSLDGALRVLKQHSHKPALKEFTGGIERKLKEGKSFSQALSDYPAFSPMYINIVRAGEEGGILPSMLAKIAEYQATFQELKQFILSASIYPIFLMTVGFTAVIILLTFILPKFEVLFEGMGREQPANVRFLMELARLMSSHFILTFLALVGPPLALVSYLKSSEGSKRYDRLAVRLPLLSGFIRDLETSRIFRTLEVLVKNGVHLATALKISSGVAGNREYRKLLNRATEALKEGQAVGQKLKGQGLLPDMAADLLSIGEESGRVGEVCGQIADYYEKALRTRTKRVLALIEPLFILVIAIGAGYVVYTMLSVILSINDIVT